MAAQGQQLARHLGAGGIGVAPGRLGELVLRIDPSIERLTHLAGAHGRVVVALDHLDAGLLGADRSAATCASASKAARRASSADRRAVDQRVHELLAQPGNAGDGANLGIDRRSVSISVGGGSAGVSAGTVVDLGHDASFANGGAGIGRRRNEGDFDRRPGDGGADAFAGRGIGVVAPALDRVADRDMAQDAGEHVLPDRLDLGPGRELQDRSALAAIDAGIAHRAEHVAHRGLAVIASGGWRVVIARPPAA